VAFVPLLACSRDTHTHHSRHLSTDHLFHTGYQQTFLELVRRHKKDHHFRFDAVEEDENETKK
jgi:hypothetical protein